MSSGIPCSRAHSAAFEVNDSVGLSLESAVKRARDSLVQIRERVTALGDKALHVAVDDRQRLFDKLLREELAGVSYARRKQISLVMGQEYGPWVRPFEEVCDDAGEESRAVTCRRAFCQLHPVYS